MTLMEAIFVEELRNANNRIARDGCLPCGTVPPVYVEIANYALERAEKIYAAIADKINQS